MNLMRMELKKTNIKSYFFAASAIFICLLGLAYIFAWVPSLGTADPYAVELFSTYQGISAMGGAVGLMAFSALASAMGYRYVIREYSGANVILLFTYPVDRKSIVWAKIKLLLLFVSASILVCTFGSFIVFALTGYMFSLLDDNLQFIDIAIAYRNSLVLACLADGITLCSLRIGFIKKSNSMTIISAILLSMLLVNMAADINQSFAIMYSLSSVIFVTGLLLTFNMVRKVERMEI